MRYLSKLSKTYKANLRYKSGKKKQYGKERKKTGTSAVERGC